MPLPLPSPLRGLYFIIVYDALRYAATLRAPDVDVYDAQIRRCRLQPSLSRHAGHLPIRAATFDMFRLRAACRLP